MEIITANLRQLEAAGIVRLVSGARPPAHVAAKVRRMREAPELSPLAAFAREIEAAILVPASKFDFSQATALRMSLRNRLQDAVGRVMGQATVIRDFTSKDLTGAASGAQGFARLSNQNALVANTYFNKDVTKALDQKTSIGFYGFVQLAKIPNIDEIQFFLGSGLPLAQFNLDSIYADQQSNVGYFDPPVVFAPGQTIQVNLLASAAVVANAEQYNLLGYVAEPQGQTVAPDQANLI